MLTSNQCDESKPSCKRCRSYGVSCSYIPITENSASLLQLPSELTTIVKLFPSPLYFPDIQSELLTKFQCRTALTVTTSGRLSLYQNEVVTLAHSKPYLMNSILALTLLHENHISGAAYSPAASSFFSSTYYTKAITSFNGALSAAQTSLTQSSRLISAEYQAALWTTSAMLGTIAFGNIPSANPFESWPLTPSSPSDLDWLKMTDGKQSVYKVTRGIEADPTYKPLFDIHTSTLLPTCTTAPSFDRLPPELLSYFNAYGTPNDDDALFHPSIKHLARVHDLQCPIIRTILTFWTWCTEMTPMFKSLLEQKDPRALLITAYWWAEIYQTTVWWLARRARVEGLAICIYLESYHADDEVLGRLAQYPRVVFETDFMGGGVAIDEGGAGRGYENKSTMRWQGIWNKI